MSRWKLTSLERAFAAELLKSRPHHVQSSLAWLDYLLAYSDEDDRSLTILHDDRPIGFLCALQYKRLVQSLPFPAGYAGIQLLRTLDPAEERELYEAIFAHYSRYCDVVSLCTSPFFEQAPTAETQFDFTARNDVHYINLKDEPLARTSSKFRNNLKRNLRKAEDAGVKVAVSRDAADLAKWYRCYDKRIDELGGTKLTEQYFISMFEHLSETGLCSLIAAKDAKKFLGGIVTVQNGYCVDYYLSMFDRDEDDKQASTAAFHFLLEHARQSGATYLNLQASPRSQTDLLHFKESWGALQSRHSYRVKILNNREAILHMSPHVIKHEYPFHYLLPFDALKPVVSYA